MRLSIVATRHALSLTSNDALAGFSLDLKWEGLAARGYHPCLAAVAETRHALSLQKEMFFRWIGDAFALLVISAQTGIRSA